MSERRLRKLAQALCDKLRKVHASEEYKGIWVFAKNHGLIYDGPTYSNELALLDAYLHGEVREEPMEEPAVGLYQRLGVDNFREQPDPWEAWVEEMPNPVFDFEQCTGINWSNWCERMRQHFRKMPRGK